jgi:REP element-mobilizing transposase RayT
LTSHSESESTGAGKTGRSKPSKESVPAANNVHFEPFEQRAYDMSYACLLIPRDPRHLLTGKVPEFIQRTLEEACTTFGWSLHLVQVRPEYFQWVLSTTAGTPPSKCIRMIRDQTSRGVLTKFKEFQDKTTPYQDFWAPGYLVLVGAEPHPAAIIEEFIVLTRQQQGLPRQGIG